MPEYNFRCKEAAREITNEFHPKKIIDLSQATVLVKSKLAVRKLKQWIAANYKFPTQ